MGEETTKPVKFMHMGRWKRYGFRMKSGKPLVFKDGIEHGAGPQIPLYLAGFLY